jgi:hypothetical protein
MAKIRAVDVLDWTAVVLQLITIGATTAAKVKQSMIDAGHAEDDARLLALDAEYAARIERAKQAAAGG